MADRLFYFLCVAALVVGTLYRLLPIALGDDALAQLFTTEDGYLMLTVARNMAVGLGMTVSEGTIPTNGVQPLATFLFTIPYLLTGGDKTASLIGIHLISAAIALAAALCVRSFAAKALEREAAPAFLAWFVAALWFAGPLLIRHSMNALETGLYTLCVLLAMLQFYRVLERGQAASFADRLILGGLCGVAFLARNDAIFLCVGIFGFWLLHTLVAQRLSLVTAVARLIPPGLVSVMIAAPWLIHNQIRFGSIVPISGPAQSQNALFGQNASLLPAKFFENLLPMLPIPGAIERSLPIVATLATISIVLVLTYAVRVWRGGGTIRYVLAAYATLGVLLVTYYGLFFGAPHFLSRYLAPLAPLLILASVSVLWGLARSIAPRIASPLSGSIAALGLLLCALLAGRTYLAGYDQGHFQVVNWVDENVEPDVWVGAVQTGTLGYWHDRTINLDGKVNPDALASLKSDGHALDYILQSPIVYLADWAGIAEWVNRTESDFHNTFEIVVDDPASNLAVLRRVAASS